MKTTSKFIKTQDAKYIYVTRKVMIRAPSEFKNFADLEQALDKFGVNSEINYEHEEILIESDDAQSLVSLGIITQEVHDLLVEAEVDEIIIF